ncbi:MAG: hypothetical protein HWE34_12695 [Methylocystaceae bacterium]|nr:hypothetical protein [Methylocystaceae bacterium]
MAIKTYLKVGADIVDADAVQNTNDRTFRDAWALEGDVIAVDMVKARDIWREKIRAARVPVFNQLDADFMKALESGNVTSQQTIALQKQALRDATDDPTIDSALSPDDLKLVQPAGLVIA